MMPVESVPKKKKEKKGELKKKDTRVDFTPMVDMIMLLLTFFMLATTLNKPQTMEIAVPTKEKPLTKDESNVVKESDAVTLFLGADNKIYYFLGRPDLETPGFLKTTDYSSEGLRKILLDKNRSVVAQVNELKDRKTRMQISEEAYESQLKELKNSKRTPVVIIKPLDNSTYDNLVSALDEMLITSVGKYAITDLDDNDIKLLANSNVAFTAK